MGLFVKETENQELPKRKYCFTEEEAKFFRSSGIKTCELALLKWIIFLVMALVLVFAPLFRISLGIVSVKVSLFTLYKQMVGSFAGGLGAGVIAFPFWVMFAVLFVINAIGIIPYAVGISFYSKTKAEEFMKKREKFNTKKVSERSRKKRGIGAFNWPDGSEFFLWYFFLAVIVGLCFLAEILTEAEKEQIISIVDINTVPIGAIIIFVLGTIAVSVVHSLQKKSYQPHFEMFKNKFDESIENAKKEEEQKRIEEENRIAEEEKAKEEMYQKIKSELRQEMKQGQSPRYPFDRR